MNFTKEEINLCKQVAKRHRKEIKYGDWFEFKGNILPQKDMHEPEMSDRCIPPWTISDCLEFLRATPGLHTLEIIGDYQKLMWLISMNITDMHRGETALEVCLKAVLAVLEEE